MMKVAALLLLVPALAHADDTFEAKVVNAQRIHRIENVVWALTAACDKGDDTEQRQCRKVRDARAAELAGATLFLDGDADAFDVGAWNAQKKSVPMTLAACVRCAGVEVDGKSYILSGPGAHADGGKIKANLLLDNARPFDDEAAAQKWTKQLATAKVQFVVKLPAKPKITVDGKPGFQFDVVAYRVYTPCDGAIVIANPPSAAAEADKKQCPAATAVAAQPEAEKPKLEALSTSMIRDAMQPAVDAAQKCFEQFGVTGTAKLKITIAGDGSLARYEQQGDFVKTPTGDCIDAAAKQLTFPRSRKAKTSITFPILLQ